MHNPSIHPPNPDRIAARLTVYIGLALLATSSGAKAADSSDIYSLSLAELAQVEVASGFLEDIADAASSVSVVTEEEWRRQGAEKTFDAIEHVPGVYVSEYFHGQMVPAFRGFSGAGQYNSFLVLLDGIPLNNYSSSTATYGTPNFALGNLRNIEVIRGPGSALYGANAFNGTVSLNTWASDTDTYEGWVETGSFGYRQANARLRHAFTDSISLTSALTLSRVDDEEIENNFHASVPGAPLVESEVSGKYKNLTTTNKLNMGNLDAALYYSRHDVDDSFGAGEVFPIFPNGHHSDGEARMWAASLAYTANLPATWTLDTKLYHVEDELFGSFGLANVGAPPEPPSLDWDSKDQRTGLNVVARKPFANSNTQLLLGLNYDRIVADHFGASVTGAPPTVLDKQRRLLGVLGQFVQQYFDKALQLTIGARFDDYSDFGNHLSPRVALVYRPNAESSLKLLYGNAYRAPAVNEQTDSGIVKGGGDELDPETVNTIELIWMHSQTNWRYGVHTYYSKVKDSINIGLSPDPAFPLGYSNNVRAESYGVEIDGRLESGRWRFDGNVAWNHIEQTQPAENEQPFSAYPDLILNLGAYYSFNENLRLTLYNTVHDGRKTLHPGSDLAPSYPDSERLPTLWRTDLDLRWKPTQDTFRYSLYLNILDILDRTDTLSAMTPVEIGRGTPGRKVTLGAEITF